MINPKDFDVLTVDAKGEVTAYLAIRKSPHVVRKVVSVRDIAVWAAGKLGYTQWYCSANGGTINNYSGPSQNGVCFRIGPVEVVTTPEMPVVMEEKAPVRGKKSKNDKNEFSAKMERTNGVPEKHETISAGGAPTEGGLSEVDAFGGAGSRADDSHPEGDLGGHG